MGAYDPKDVRSLKGLRSTVAQIHASCLKYFSFVFHAFEELHGVWNNMIKQMPTFAADFGCGCVGFHGLGISDTHP